MTNPLAAALAGAGGGAGPVVQTGGSGLDQTFALILQSLQASKARKDRQAATALGQVAPGTKFADLSPDAQKSVSRATGRTWHPDEVVNPIPASADEASIDRIMNQLHIDPKSTLGVGLKLSYARKSATGAAAPLETVAGATADTQTGDIVAGANLSRATSLESGLAKQKAGTTSTPASLPQKGNTLQSGAGAAAPSVPATPQYTPDELSALQNFNGFVPSEPIANQLTGQAKTTVMAQALRIAGDPNSATWATLLPNGVTPADVIGGVGLGLGQILESGISKRNITEASAQVEANRAIWGVAEDVSKAMKGAYAPPFIVAVMSGDPKVSATPAGQMVRRFLDAGFMTGLTEQAAKGDPGMIALTHLMELARVPQIAGNQDLLAEYSNLIRTSVAGSITRTHLGYDRPAQPGTQQRVWDLYNASILKKVAGTFSKSWVPFTTMQIAAPDATPGGAKPDPVQARRDADAAMLEAFVKAMGGAVTPAAPAAGAPAVPAKAPGTGGTF